MVTIKIPLGKMERSPIFVEIHQIVSNNIPNTDADSADDIGGKMMMLVMVLMMMVMMVMMIVMMLVIMMMMYTQGLEGDLAKSEQH